MNTLPITGPQIQGDRPRTVYVITGTLTNGRRFRPIVTETPWHYNIWNGTLWEQLPNGRRRKVREYRN